MGFTDAPSPDAGLAFVIDGGGAVITTGEKGHLVAPYSGTITVAEIENDVQGSIVVDIWKDVYANFPPTDADSITSSTPPTITNARSARDTTLTGWTKTVTKGDVLAYNVDSVSLCTRAVVTLYIEKS